MNDVQAKIIVALIGLLGTILGILAGFYARSKKEAVKEAKREQEQADLFKQIFKEMTEIKNRLDTHNRYAEKFSEVNESIITIKKDIEYLRKDKRNEKDRSQATY